MIQGFRVQGFGFWVKEAFDACDVLRGKHFAVAGGMASLAHPPKFPKSCTQRFRDELNALIFKETSKTSKQKK